MSTERKTLEERAQMSDIERLRHSCAHVMATAILRIWPDAQFAYGPPIENGFYYDFQMKHRVTPDDFEKIEAEMKKISKENQKFEWQGISREDAKAMAESGRLGGLSERPGNPSIFKLDLIDKIPEGEQISCFKNGDFIDLCAGPHVGYSGKCKNVKLTSVSSSFYMGDDTKPQLQRLYGTAFESKEDLEAHFVRLEEAKKRDHRRLGKELKLFHIDEDVGQGLILWTPNGAVLRATSFKISSAKNCASRATAKSSHRTSASWRCTKPAVTSLIIKSRSSQPSSSQMRSSRSPAKAAAVLK
jgi:threonyl-tRNA synthetase